MKQHENETVTQAIRRLYKEHKNRYGYLDADVAARAFINPSTIYRVIGGTDDDELYQWGPILNILFAVGVDQKELRQLNRRYREALAAGVPVKRSGGTSVRLPAVASTEMALYGAGSAATETIGEGQKAHNA